MNYTTVILILLSARAFHPFLKHECNEKRLESDSALSTIHKLESVFQSSPQLHFQRAENDDEYFHFYAPK